MDTVNHNNGADRNGDDDRNSNEDHSSLVRPVSRREFLEWAAMAALIAGSPSGISEALAEDGRRQKKHKMPGQRLNRLTGGFEDRYRLHYTDWDEVTIGTHNINCWFQQNCNFHIFTKDGRVVREEQVADYPALEEGVPDYNPRGCQKGCSYSRFMYSKSRLTRPLKRDGERGSGKWKAVSWDEALDDIAGRIYKTLLEHNPRSIVVDPGGNLVNYLTFYSMFRLFDLLDGTILDINTELGDDQQGAALTYGEISSDRSGGDFFYSDLILIWGGNPAYTQIPNFHFITEARYNGAKVVSIAPDLNASAIHADVWLPVKPGCDAALANAMAHVIIEEQLYDEEIIREQTDLPFLVVEETGRFLRESDLKEGGDNELLYRYDLNESEIVSPSLKNLDLDGEKPALNGRYTVQGLKGRLTVVPVFELLRKRLKDYTPEKAAAICGVSAANIRWLAREMAAAKAASNVCTSSISKFYHGDIMMRSMILVFALCGHVGKKGAGYVAASFLVADGSTRMVTESRHLKEKRLSNIFQYGSDYFKNLVRRGHRAAIFESAMQGFAESGLFVNSTLFWNLHGGLLEVSGRSEEWDPWVKKPVKEYIDHALSEKWQAFAPDEYTPPRIMFSWAGNSLRRVRGAQHLIDKLIPQLDLIVALEMRMSSTAMYCDYVLPVAGAYEKTTTMAANTSPMVPFLHMTRDAVKPAGQSKDEWQIACAIAERIQRLARADSRGKNTFTTRSGASRRIDRLYDYMTFRRDPDDAAGISEQMVDDSTNLDGGWDEMQKKGYTRFTGMGHNPANWGNATEIKKGHTISPHTDHIEKKEPWLTLSGRMQFYIDHDWYLEFEEELPVHKNPPTSGGNYPLVLTGGHTRWSIHAQWQTDELMLNLQRGEPCLYISKADAARRGIKDHDRIRVFNDIDFFITRAKVTPGVQPGQVIMYHAWESYQFEGWNSYRNVLASPLKPLELVGDRSFMRPMLATRQPGQSDRDTRVEIEAFSGSFEAAVKKQEAHSRQQKKPPGKAGS